MHECPVLREELLTHSCTNKLCTVLTQQLVWGQISLNERQGAEERMLMMFYDVDRWLLLMT